MKITRIESLTFGVEDVAASSRYYDDWGLTGVQSGATGKDYVLPSGQTVKLRSLSDSSLPAAIEGGSTLRECVWGVDGKATIEEIGAELGKDQKLTLDSSGVLHGKDPWGMPIAFQVENAQDVKAGPDRLNRPFMPAERVTPTRMGHVVFFVPKDRAREISDFYTDRLQFRLSDRSGGLGDFMRCAGAKDHHNLFLLAAKPVGGFNHVAFEVNGFDEVLQGGKHMKDKGWKPATKLGRHILGSNIFWYFDNPAGGNTEYFADMDLMDDNWEPRVWEKHPGWAHWEMD
jgi:catechol 2,3-dioxygenase-like lactoylglutathione lyase family enzyme